MRILIFNNPTSLELLTEMQKKNMFSLVGYKSERKALQLYYLKDIWKAQVPPQFQTVIPVSLQGILRRLNL